MNPFDRDQEENPLLCMYRKSEGSTPKLVPTEFSLEALSSVLVCLWQFHWHRADFLP
jgi:hypothetical protein